LGFVLDSIRKLEVLQAPETINDNWESPSFSLDDREGEFAVTFQYENGSSVNMQIMLQLSLDNTNFVDMSGTEQEITDEDGTHLWDIAGSGAVFARVKVLVTDGSIDISKITYVAKQRH
jgi:hypothetical protein